MIRQITVRELADRLEAATPTLLVDVRQSWEHEIAFLPGSVLIPLPLLPRRVGEIQPMAGSLVVVYCHHGIRSLQAAEFLQQAGIGEVASLAGGIDAWSIEIDQSVRRY